MEFRPPRPEFKAFAIAAWVTVWFELTIPWSVSRTSVGFARLPGSGLSIPLIKSMSGRFAPVEVYPGKPRALVLFLSLLGQVVSLSFHASGSGGVLGARHEGPRDTPPFPGWFWGHVTRDLMTRPPVSGGALGGTSRGTSWHAPQFQGGLWEALSL